MKLLAISILLVILNLSVIGQQSADNKRYWRVDWDDNVGAHINWVNGKEKGSIPFSGDLEQAKRIVNNVLGN
jgi:hypothetical protein